MVPKSQVLTREAVSTPKARPTYRTLLLRLGLVRARLRARAAVYKYRPYATADDCRLAATVVAGGMAFITWLASAIVGFTATTCIILVAIGFFATLGVGLVLLFGPDDYDCEAELAEVTGLLPEAKRVWHEQRIAAQAARKQARAARKQARVTRVNSLVDQTGIDETGIVDLVEPVPDHEPYSVPEVLEGDGSFAVPVLGEVHIGRILEDVCRNELPQVGEDKVVRAMVRMEKSNRTLRGVTVEIGGRKVGHLSPGDVQALWKRAGEDSQPFECPAVIQGVSKGGRIHYDLRLDINLRANCPAEMSASY
jgi:hypothetical protein